MPVLTNLFTYLSEWRTKEVTKTDLMGIFSAREHETFPTHCAVGNSPEGNCVDSKKEYPFVKAVSISEFTVSTLLLSFIINWIKLFSDQTRNQNVQRDLLQELKNAQNEMGQHLPRALICSDR